ncbi:response regulator [Labilibaculum sp. A4]|uniref:Response regulator n=2 Tax=Labilibaculum TaxID=2060722 RepID=A0A425YBS3_9BACT|nr:MULTISPECIES: LytTR family DNA-binding domain-containing protein [Labilibaculum]MDQ1771465.1 LytTR family DNA-binding domain-containing protein [Labilibaculum euxinus]MUP38274.1 response regulator [Labilibaculum euxinus]MVB07479.1 response regulator [Labilibaculum euxinus]MWN76647.1 response regulator [Labilibaculum euxinus]PKQ69521.1 DNA-binding response regulator [Labilibaculum manganireducens]
MNVVIIEDEVLAADKLERLLHKYDPKIKVIDRFDSVTDSSIWLGNPSNKADLIFLDIHLVDGLSFEIFNRVQVQTPIIFTTAYNEYALNAFKLNSIDYLLKPVTFDNLYTSLKKLEHLKESLTGAGNMRNFEELSNALATIQKNYKTRFMVKIGEKLRSFKAEDISVFYADGRDVFILLKEGNRYIIDYKMEELQDLLNPEQFYRISRSFIVNINSINGVSVHSNSRLKVDLSQEFDRELIVSREKVGSFKDWFNGAG